MFLKKFRRHCAGCAGANEGPGRNELKIDEIENYVGLQLLECRPNAKEEWKSFLKYDTHEDIWVLEYHWWINFQLKWMGYIIGRYESWEITFIENVQTKNGSVTLLWRNAKCNVNHWLSYFEQCALACLHLHFAFRQSKAMLQIYYKSRLYYRYVWCRRIFSKWFMSLWML